jgi:hypothetical protein
MACGDARDARIVSKFFFGARMRMKRAAAAREAARRE